MNHKSGLYHEVYIQWLKGDKRFNKKLTKEEVRFADTIKQLHDAKIFFRIEGFWDIGFTVTIVDGQIKPSRVEVDEMNCLQFDNLNRDTTQQIEDLIAIPRPDWIEKVDDFYIENLSDKLAKYIGTKIP